VRVQKPSELKITDSEVKNLIKFLMKSAKTSLEASYQAQSGEVTKAQISEAQQLLDNASRLVKSGRHTKDSVNDILRDLYRVIPRKMADTRKYFLRDDYQETFLIELLQSEQNLLDTLESQSKTKGAKLTQDTFGLDIAVASKADQDLIAAKTDFKVTNRAMETAF
jgi:hypothetical protein